MSEPRSTGDIEDVLASIRRLVSDDLRPQGGARGASARPAADRLILTPALRVVSDSEDAVGAGDPPGDAPLAEGAPETAGETTGEAGAAPLAAVVANLGDAIDSAPQDWEDEAGLPEASGIWDQSAPEDEDVAPEEAPDAPHDPVAPAWAEAAAQAAIDELSAGIEAEVITRMDPDPSHDGDRGHTGVDGGDADGMDADGPVYDEAHLRELVRDILREELQGALGERITRNVRKLVRAEIARAMTLRDFT